MSRFYLASYLLALTLAAPSAAQVEIDEFVIRKGNLIEVLAPDDSIDLQEIIDEITDAAEDNRYLIRLGPGRFQLEFAETVRLKGYVDLAGSGQDTTEIRGGTSGFGLDCDDEDFALVAVPDNSVLSDLTVMHFSTAGSSGGRAVCNTIGSSPTIRKVTVRSIAPAMEGQRFGFYLAGGEPRLEDVTVFLEEGEDTFGLYCKEGSPTLDRASLTASNASDNNRAIWLVGTCSLEIRDVVAAAEGGVEAQGAYAQTGTSIDVHQGRFKASGGDENLGLLVQGTGEATLNGVRLLALAGTSSNGIKVQGDAQLRLFRGAVSGVDAAIDSDSTVTAIVNQSSLDGGVSGSGTLACVGSDDGNGAALDPTCN